MFSSLFLSLSRRESIRVPKTNGKRGREGRINGYQETTYGIKTRVKEKNKIKKSMEKLFGSLRRKKVSIGKELISKAYHSRAEPSVTYSQLTRSYFCVTFPICNFRAAFTSNYPAASRNLPFPPPFPTYISLLIPCLSRPSNFAPLSLTHTHFDQISSFPFPWLV